MRLNPAPCCAPFIDLHGQPAEFASQLFPEPAADLAEYVAQTAQLDTELGKIEACAHYRHVARIAHIDDGKRDNSEHSEMLLVGHFCGFTAEYTIELTS